MTTIQDVLTYADGSKANGRLAVFWRPFTIGNANVTGGELVYDIVDGAVLVTVYPNAGALPSGTYYSAKYELENGVVYIEQWIVPNLPTVNLGQVRVSFPPTPSILISPTQLTSMNAQPGMFLMWDGVRWVPGYPSTFNLNPNWIGINIGGLGSDVNVEGSPVSVGNYATIHVPDAGPAARGVVTTAAQTIGGPKTFQNRATISQSLLFTQHTVYTAIRGELVNIGSGAAHSLNFGGDIVALRIAGTDRTRMQADRLVSGQLDLDTIADPPTATMPGTPLSPLKGAETISLPHDGIDWAGIGMAVDGSLWLRTAGAFLYLNANGVTCRELRMDPYQHPNAVGVEAARSDATMVVYSDSMSWGGYGVDNTPQLWFRMGPNSGGAYYYFGSGGATFPSLAVTNLSVSGSLIVPPGAGLIPTYWIDGVLAGTRPILNFISGENIGITGVDVSDHNRVDITINSGGTGGLIIDPTDTKGDLIVRGADLPAAVTKLGVGTNGQVLTADNTVVTGIKWAVATVAGDSSTQRLQISQGGVLKGTRHELNLIAGANVTLTVVDVPGNNRVDATVAVGTSGALQSPWATDIDAANHMLYGASKIGIGRTPEPSLDVVGSGIFRAAPQQNASSGGGLRVGFDTGVGGYTDVLSYDWTASAFRPMQIRGNPTFFPSGFVGIGYASGVGTTPGCQLEITHNGASTFGVAINIKTMAGTDGPRIGFEAYNGGTPKSWNAGIVNSGNGFVIAEDSAPLVSGFGINRLAIIPGGNVGIGTVAPGHKLTVENGNVFIRDSTADNSLFLTVQEPGGVSINVRNYNYSAFKNLTLAGGGGFVGVRTGSPNYMFSLGPELGDKLAVWDSGPGTAYGFGMQSGLLQIYSQGTSTRVGIGFGASASFTEVFTVNGNGCVGIGVTTPNDALVINGLRGGQYGQLRMVQGNYGCFFRNDGTTWYFMVTANGDPMGTWSGGYPISIDLASHTVVFGAPVNVNAALGVLGSITTSGGLTTNAGTGINTSGISYVNSNTVNSDFNNCAIQVRESQQAGGASSGDNRYAPRISFHWGGVVASQIGMDNSGTIRTFDNPGTGYATFACNGLITFNNATINGSLTTGYINCTGITASGDITTYRAGAGANTGVIFLGNTANNYVYYDGTNIQLHVPGGTATVNGVPVSTGAPGVSVQFGGGAASGPYTFLNFFGFSGVTCSSGGSTSNAITVQISLSSDMQLKRNVESLNGGGLPLIAQLRPVTAEWNGLAGTREGERVVSVIAQELREVIPDAVHPYRTKLRAEDSEDTELLSISPMAVVSHLILAVQQLERRLKVLEGRN